MFLEKVSYKKSGIVTSMRQAFSKFVRGWTQYLNKDEELQRRLGNFRTFSGGPCPLPGPGPYPPPTLAYDPTGWTKAKGYPSSILNGKELIYLNVEETLKCVIKLENFRFRIKEDYARNACLSCKMPLQVFKDLILGKQRVIWALADKMNEVSYVHGLALSDWITILEVLVCARELVEGEPEMWELIQSL